MAGELEARSTGPGTMLARTGEIGVRAGSPVGKEEGAPQMLVLTRKSNQSIMIGDDIEVSVLSVMGEKVRIGIQAPQAIPVFRKEIYLEIHREAGTAVAESDARRRQPAERQRSTSAAARELPATVRLRPLAEQQVQRAEHDDGDDHRGQDQRQHEQREAHRAALADGARPRA